MIPRYELDVQTGVRHEIMQRVYTNEAKEVLVLDDGEDAPFGFAEYTGNLNDLENPDPFE